MNKIIKLLTLLSITTGISYASTPLYVDAAVGINTSWGSLAYNGNFGYLLNQYIGIEGGLTYSSGYNYSWSTGSYNTADFMYDAAIKGILPITEQFNLYAKVGAGFNNYNTWNGCSGCSGPTYSGSNVGLLYGAGANFNLSEQWSVHLEDYTVTGTNPNFLMFGAAFKF